MDFSSLLAAVDFTAVGTALLAIGAVMVVPEVVRWGTRKVLSLVEGESDDPWDGYSDEDDARDREAAGLSRRD